MNFLVIGYGNTLRNDDGAGQVVAEKVANWNVPGLRSLCLHQLYPELATEMAEVELVIFVDVYPAATTQPVKVSPLEPLSSNLIRSHFSDPRVLLNLTQSLYSCCPEAWWILIPGENFEVGDRLSSVAEKGVSQALIQIRNLIPENEVF